MKKRKEFSKTDYMKKGSVLKDCAPLILLVVTIVATLIVFLVILKIFEVTIDEGVLATAFMASSVMSIYEILGLEHLRIAIKYAKKYHVSLIKAWYATGIYEYF